LGELRDLFGTLEDILVDADGNVHIYLKRASKDDNPIKTIRRMYKGEEVTIRFYLLGEQVLVDEQ